MKIAFVVHDYHRLGGHSRYTFELAERFAREHEVHVFANRIEEEGSAPIRFHRIPALRTTALTTILSFQIPATAAIGSGFDVVHAQGLSCFGANVITAHICSQTWYESRRSSNDPVRPHEHVFASIVNRAERALYRRSGNAEIIAVSRLIARNLNDAYGRSDRVSVIYHGVDLERFSPSNRATYRGALRRDLGIPDSALVALWVGDLRKGAITAIDAIADATGWRLHFVSRTAPDRYIEHAAQRGVSDRVSFSPHSSRIEEYYAASDAFLFPSAYDAFGMVVTEAMASGIPVLVSRAAGASELVEDGVSGHVLESPHDGAEAARHLNAWSADRSVLARQGDAARAAVQPYTWDAIAEQTLAVYERAAKRRKS